VSQSKAGKRREITENMNGSSHRSVRTGPLLGTWPTKRTIDRKISAEAAGSKRRRQRLAKKKNFANARKIQRNEK